MARASGVRPESSKSKSTVKAAGSGFIIGSGAGAGAAATLGCSSSLATAIMKRSRQAAISSGWKFSSCSCIQQSKLTWASAASSGLASVAPAARAFISRVRWFVSSPTLSSGRLREEIISGSTEPPLAASMERMAK